MSDIDWSKAPEGATHYRPSTRRWYRQDTHAYEWNGFVWCELGCSDLVEYAWSGQLIERHAEPAWTGTGLPPVGTVCEVCDADGNWHSCRVLAHYLEDAVFVPDPDYPYGEYDGLPIGRFRPIRTPEQIAAEEREKAIDAMNKLVGDIEKIPTWRDALAALYDAGYRKTEAP